MAVELTLKANEKSTYVISASFEDESDIPFTPNSGLTWTLTDSNGTVINSRLDVSITPSQTINIILQGDDLQMLGGESGSVRRYVTIEGTYDSALGSGLPIKEEITFFLRNLVAIT